jgi:hypothetical protein
LKYLLQINCSISNFDVFELIVKLQSREMKVSKSRKRLFFGWFGSVGSNLRVVGDASYKVRTTPPTMISHQKGPKITSEIKFLSPYCYRN